MSRMTFRPPVASGSSRMIIRCQRNQELLRFVVFAFEQEAEDTKLILQRRGATAFQRAGDLFSEIERVLIVSVHRRDGRMIRLRPDALSGQRGRSPRR